MTINKHTAVGDEIINEKVTCRDSIEGQCTTTHVVSAGVVALGNRSY